MVGVVTPDRCGFGLRIADLPDGDRQVVEEYHAFLCGGLDYDPKTNEFVPAGEGVSRDQMRAKKENPDG
jgi:hypothetical protein